jgi:hypothetical protein
VRIASWRSHLARSAPLQSLGLALSRIVGDPALHVQTCIAALNLPLRKASLRYGSPAPVLRIGIDLIETGLSY